MKSKILLVLFSTLFVTILSFLYLKLPRQNQYYSIPVSAIDNASNWQIFSDPIFGYQFSCPSKSVHQVQAITLAPDQPLKLETCTEKNQTVTVQVFDANTTQNFSTNVTNSLTVVRKTPDQKFLLVITGLNPAYFDQILSTFRFTN